LSLQLGYPLEAAYKPLVDGWAQREMLKARSRFGAELVPDDVARLVLFLAADDSSAITNQSCVIDGGWV